MPAGAGHRNSELSAEVGGKLLGLMIEDRLAEQRADTMSCSAAVQLGVPGVQVHAAEIAPRAYDSLLENAF